MMKTLKLISSLFLLFIFIGCSNDSDDGQPTVAVPAPTSDGFKYAENGSTTMISVSTPYASNQYKSIFGVDNSNTIIEINLTSIAQGTYTIDNSTNFFSYLKPGSSGIWSGTTGTVTITSNANNKLSGSFSMSAGSGINGVNTVNGTFTNITIQ